MGRQKNKVTIIREVRLTEVSVTPTGFGVGFNRVQEIDEEPTDPDNVQLPAELVFETAVEAASRQVKEMKYPVVIDERQDWKDPGTRQPAHVRINQQGKPTIR